ncbi:tetratricopeptide repeat protein [Amylibacter sp.]|nr:tetratricopeptide repeat protein [Amylibacter sp.]
MRSEKASTVVTKLTINQVLQQAVDAHKSGQLQEAHRLYATILKIQPKHPDANHNTGLLNVGFGKIELALPFFKTALEANPSNVQFWYSHIVVLIKLERLIDAKVLLNQAKGKGIKGADFNQLEQRLNDAIKTLPNGPDYVSAHYNMGIALQKQNKLEEAIEAYNKALAIKPDYAEAHYNMGIALQKQNKLEEAIEACNKALAIKPDYAAAYNNIGFALNDQNKLEEAIEAYNKALDIKPDYESARAVNLHQHAHICNWDNIAKDVKLIPELGTSDKHVSPFALLPLEDAPDRHLIRSKIYAKAKYPEKALSSIGRPSKKPKRIRIGYFSTDFKEHPVAYLISKVLEQHNRDEFEVFGYSVHGSSSCTMRQRLEKSFDNFTDVQSMSDRDITLKARQDKIDIAVDLNGYTKNTRTGIFAYRAAPIQINYLGYPGTLGADFMDYIVADRFLIPSQNQKHFNEEPLYLPNTYMPTDNSREMSKKKITRSDMGLPDDAFVFCCFNNNYKISPNEFDIWMRLLTKVENSVLWLRQSNQFSNINMKNEAQKRKVDPSRLVFADKVPMDEHLARQRFADLFLDTFAFNAHTTASEALWAGLPVVTKVGLGFAARVAGSLLNAVGLPELVTETEQDYEELILELATNPTKLSEIKDKLATNRLTQPLFDTDLYTKHLENGYQQAYQNYFDGNLPQTIIVPK